MTEHRCPCSCHSSTPSPGWCPPSWLLATQADLRLVHDAIEALGKALSRDVKKLEKMIMASQADVDALAAALHQEDSDLNAAVTGITQKLADLQAAVDAGQPVDLSALSAEVDGLRGAVDSAAALVPAPSA